MQKIFEFSITFVFIFFGAITVLGIFGLLPADLQNSMNSHPLSVLSWQSASSTEPAAQSANVANVANASSAIDPTLQPTAVTDAPAIQYTPSGTVELPVRITISAIGLDDPILNPSTTDADIFESDLEQGVVRWPTSAPLNTTGNIFLFGHSSYLKIVYNKHYQSFNGIQNLKAGDQIVIEGPQTTSIYQVSSVSFLTDVEANIDVGGNQHQLILSTCNVLAAKEDRIVVVSNFVRSYQNQ